MNLNNLKISSFNTKQSLRLVFLKRVHINGISSCSVTLSIKSVCLGSIQYLEVFSQCLCHHPTWDECPGSPAGGARSPFWSLSCPSWEPGWQVGKACLKRCCSRQGVSCSPEKSPSSQRSEIADCVYLKPVTIFHHLTLPE